MSLIGGLPGVVKLVTAMAAAGTVQVLHARPPASHCANEHTVGRLRSVLHACRLTHASTEQSPVTVCLLEYSISNVTGMPDTGHGQVTVHQPLPDNAPRSHPQVPRSDAHAYQHSNAPFVQVYPVVPHARGRGQGQGLGDAHTREQGQRRPYSVAGGHAQLCTEALEESGPAYGRWRWGTGA